jgi:predicted Zn-dependent protease
MQADLHVLRSDQVNAFALPGGVVVITRELLERASGLDEVAGVLAHELGTRARASRPQPLRARDVAWLCNHPTSESRALELGAVADGVALSQPALDADAFAALQGACSLQAPVGSGM